MSWARHVPAPRLWARGAAVPASPAAAIWGADFELYGADCPMGPGPWVDRIGGIECTCVGDGDWVGSDGYAGVSKSDVCYVTLPEAAALKLFRAISDSTERTIAVIAQGLGSSPDGAQIATAAYTGIVKYESWLVVADASYCRINWRGSGGTRYGYSRVRAKSDDARLHARTWERESDVHAVFDSTTDDAVWTDSAAADAAQTYSSAALFRRYGSIGLTNTTARTLVVRSIASCVGRADAAALRIWALAEGVVWP